MTDKQPIGPTAGRWYVDVTCDVPPKPFVQGEWFVPTAAAPGAIWLVVGELGASIAVSAGIAFLIGYTFRVLALYRASEEPLAKEPAGVLQARRRASDARTQTQAQVAART